MRARAVSRIPGVLLSLLALALAPAALAQAPPNDAFGAAQPLGGETGGVTGSNVGATKERGEPAHGRNEGGSSVWYRWTAPRDGPFSFDTNGADFDTLLAVYQGASVNALTLVAEDDDRGEGLASRVVFTAVAGAEYAIAVDGYDGGEGRFSLRWRGIVPPANDAFEQARIVAGLGGTVRGTLLGATRETGEPHVRPSVWFRWTAPRSARVAFASASPFRVVVYTGASLSTLDEVASGINRQAAPFSAIAGTTYSIAVVGRGERFALFWGPVPPNDAFRDAQPIRRIRGRVSATNVLATREEGEPRHWTRASASLWYRWRAPRSGLVVFSTHGSSFDTVLAAYVGNRLTDLRALARDDDGGSGVDSVIRFRATRGVVYRIAVDGWSGSRGRISLGWRGRPSTPLSGRQ